MYNVFMVAFDEGMMYTMPAGYVHSKKGFIKRYPEKVKKIVDVGGYSFKRVYLYVGDEDNGAGFAFVKRYTIKNTKDGIVITTSDKRGL